MKKRILLIDDCQFFLNVLQEMFTEDFIVEVADSGEKAISLLESAQSSSAKDIKSHYDLVITDLEMPGINGYEVAQFIKKKNRINKYLPVIMLTDKETSKDEARKYGCAAYIPKSNLNKLVSMTKILFNVNTDKLPGQNAPE